MTMKNGDMPATPVDRCNSDAIEAGIQVFSGLTKREMMAMHMASGILNGSEFHEPDSEIASKAVRRADALLAELDKTGGK